MGSHRTLKRRKQRKARAEKSYQITFNGIRVFTDDGGWGELSRTYLRSNKYITAMHQTYLSKIEGPESGA